MVAAIGSSSGWVWSLQQAQAGDDVLRAQKQPTEDAGRTEKAQGEPQGEGARRAETGLSPDQQRQVERMAQTDREVRAHEQAHVAAGGGLVRGGASLQFETGPDGRRYAVAGEVSIDTSKGRTPEETLSRAERIRAAALAPAEPSGQDRRVAAQAAQMAADARAEMARQNAGSLSGGGEGGGRENYRGRQAAAAYGAAGAGETSRFSAYA